MAALCRSFHPFWRVILVSNVPVDYKGPFVASDRWTRALGSSKINVGNHNDFKQSPQLNSSTHQQIRTVWKGRKDATRKVDRIHIDVEKFPLELFEDSNAGKESPRSGGRITVNPDDFVLDLFESELTVAAVQEHERQNKEKILDRVRGFDPVEQSAAFSAEIGWNLKQAKRVANPRQLVDNAQDLLELWHEAAEKDSTCSVPSWKAHDRIIRAWRRIGLERPSAHAAQRADNVLQLLLKLVDEEKLQVCDSLDILFTWVIRIRLRVPETLEKSNGSAAESLLESAMRALELLLEFERFSDALNNETLCKQPKISTYSSLFYTFNNAAVLARKNGGLARHESDADAITETAARRSDELLVRMEDRAQRFSDVCSPPDAYAYRAVLSIWTCVNSQEGPERARNVLKRMEESPRLHDTPSFNRILLHAYALLSPLEVFDTENANLAVNKALSLLVRLDPELIPWFREAGYVCELPLTRETGDCESTDSKEYQSLDAVWYGTAIQALAQAGVGQGTASLEVTPALLAEIALDRMEELHQGGKLDQAPNLQCYLNVIRAHCLWASHARDKDAVAERIENILQRLEVYIQTSEGQVSSSAVNDITECYEEAATIVVQSKFGGSPSRADAILTRKRDVQRKPMNPR